MSNDPSTVNGQAASCLESSERESDELTIPLPPAREATAANFPIVPGYEILAELGRGATGDVYQARQLALNRVVALKMLHAAKRGDAEQLRRFHNEVETIARLQHPNIVPIYDVGECEGRPYFTMEFLDGGSLADHYKGQALPPKEAAGLVETLAHAMHAVHAKGIVHRDLKPSNILLQENALSMESDQLDTLTRGETRDFLSFWGGRFLPKIGDFGLARHESSDLTATGVVLGTPSYMAPEQAAGRVHEIGPAADVYALGAILYELLTGRPPFRGISVMEIVRQVQESDPIAPRRMEPRIPRDLETICLKCLRKEPSRRYSSAAALADDLRRFRQGESILARSPRWPERAARGLRRRPALAGLLLAAALLAFAVPLGLLGHTFQLRETLDRVQRESERAGNAEKLARRHEAEARIANFAADLKLASMMSNDGEVFQLPDLLKRYQLDDETACDSRDFVWSYLWQRGQKARPFAAAHEGPLHLLAYSPDGRELIAGGGSPVAQFVSVLALETGRLRWRQPLYGNVFAPPETARSAYSRRGALLAGVLRVGEKPERWQVLLWDFASGQIKFRLDFASEPRALDLSPNGHWLAVREDAGISLWDCGTGRKQCSLPAVPNVRMTFDPTGELLLLSGDLGSSPGIQWWHASTGTLRETLPTSVRYASLSFSPRGTFLLLIGADGEGAIWEYGSRLPLFWSRQLGRVRSLAMSLDEQTLATGDSDGVVRVWDVPNSRWRARYRWQSTPIVQLVFSPDHRTLCAATAEGRVHPMDAAACHAPDTLAAAAMNDGPLVWSPDGETLAAAGYGGTVHLIDRRTGRTQKVLRCPFHEVRSLAFSLDGRTLATSGEGERFARLWSVEDGRQRATTAPQTRSITALAFHPGGLLASVDDRTIRFWNAEEGAARGELLADGAITALAFTAEGRTLLTAGATLEVWNLDNGHPAAAKRVCRVPLAVPVVRLAVTRDGRRVATSGANDPVQVWWLSPERQLIRESQAPEPSRLTVALDFTPDGKSVFLCHFSDVDTCALWNPPARFFRVNLNQTRGTITRAVLSPDGQTIAAMSAEAGVCFWKTANWSSLRPAEQTLGQVHSLTFSEDGQQLISASHPLGGKVRKRNTWNIRLDGAILSRTNETVRVWDAATGRRQADCLPARETITPPHIVAASPEGRWLAAGAEDGSVQIWDQASKRWQTRLFISEAAMRYAKICEIGREVWILIEPENRDKTESVAALAFSPDGRTLAMAGTRGSFRVWDIEGWKERASWHIDPPHSPWLTFTPDSGGVVGSRGGQLLVWDARTGEPRTTWREETDSPVQCGAFVPGANVLAFGSKDGIIRLWNQQSGEAKRLPRGHQDRVTSLAFTRDGQTLASGSWDRTVRLWNMPALREVAALEGHKGRIHAVAFSPDGKVLASGGEAGAFRGEILLWRR